MTIPHPELPQPTSLSGNVASSTVHLYRAEVARMTAARVRLDTTTNWAVVISSGLLGYAFSPEGSHGGLLAAMLANFFFLNAEARHFRDFEVSNLRVRLLEKQFYPMVLGQSTPGDWRGYLARDLIKPHGELDHWEALGWRLRHNYIWIYAGLLVAWLFKLDLAASFPVAPRFSTYVPYANLDFIPGVAVLIAVALFYLWLGWLTARAHTYPLDMD